MNELDMTRLRQDLQSVAERVESADLYERVLRTSRVRRRRRAAATAGGVVAVIVAALAVFVLGPQEQDADRPIVRPTAIATTGVPSLPPQGMKAFVPPVRVSGDRESMRLTLPDGATVNLSYPKRLHVAKLGFEPVRLMANPDDGACCRAVTHLAGHPKWLRSLTGFDGRPLDVWNAAIEGDEGSTTFVRFHRWYVAVMLGAPSDAEWPRLAETVRNLELRETEDGFLLVRGHGPARLMTAEDPDNDVWSGPMLSSAWPNDHRQRQFDVARVLRCGADGPFPGERTGWQICRNGIAVRFLAEQNDQTWVQDVRAGLRIDHVDKSSKS